MAERAIIHGSINDRVNKNPNLTWDQQLENDLSVNVPVTVEERKLSTDRQTDNTANINRKLDAA